MGSACLRVHEPLTQEQAAAITTSPELQQLLQKEAFGIPNKLTAKESIKKDTQRAHLYILLDALLEVPRGGKDQGGIDACLIGAMERLAVNRKWVPTTLSSNAQALFGAMQRLDQYTKDMKPINLLTTGSYWKDANKAWVKLICGHCPALPEITPADMTSMLRKKGIRLSTHALLACCWHTSGRPTNWLYVPKRDVRLVMEEETPKRAAAEKKGEEMAPLGFKMSVTWRDHKTLGARGAFTTHSWMNVETGKKLERWMDPSNNPTNWMFPKVFWDSIKKEMADLIKETTPEGEEPRDIRCLRRGVLRTLARAGVPLVDILLFSGHTNVPQLVHYRAGVDSKELADRGEVAAKHLLPSTQWFQYQSSDQGEPAEPWGL